MCVYKIWDGKTCLIQSSKHPTFHLVPQLHALTNLFPFRKNKVRKFTKCVHVTTFEPSHQFSQNLTNCYATGRYYKLKYF